MSLASTQTSASGHKQLVERLDHLLFSLDQPAPSMLPLLGIERESISAYLHDRLTSQFEPSKWPLERLLHLLRSVLQPTQGQTQASELQLPLQLAFQHASATTTPPRSHAALPQSQSQPQRQAQSPRAIRARAHMHQLKQLAHWPDLLRVYDCLCKSEPDEAVDHATGLARIVIKQRSQLCTILPEFQSTPLNHHQLGSLVTAAYTELASRLRSFDSIDEALAFMLVHLALLPPLIPRDPEVIGTNAHLASQFGRPYRGDAPNCFLSFITQLNHSLDRLGPNDIKPYYRGTPIVQSSGTGKTRMVLELRHHTPLLYVCFRKCSADANAKAGFPFPDKGVRSFFEQAQASHPYLFNLQVACFLAAWFSTLAVSLQHHASDEQKLAHLLELNRLERSGGTNLERNTLFQDVSDGASQLLSQAPNWLKTANYQETFGHFLPQPVLDLNKQLECVSRSLHSRHPDMPMSPVVVAFDECVEMNIPGLTIGNTQLNSLRRAWNYIGTLRDEHNTLHLWLVLMSTSSSAAHLVKHIDVQSSFRRKNSAPLPTFVGVGFDVFAEERASIFCASKASSHQQIVTYGQPLWSSLEESNFWDNAVFKLQGGETFSEEDAAQCFSVMASRLALHVVPVHWDSPVSFGEQKAFTDKIVDRHMRIVRHITNQAVMHVESPSEPVLAIAASLIMLPTAEVEKLHQLGRWQEAVNTYGSILENFCRRCLLGTAIPLFRGTHGELAARIALTVAWDAAKRKALDEQASENEARKIASPTLSDRAKILSRPVPLTSIIAGLADLDEDNEARLCQRLDKVCLDGSASRHALHHSNPRVQAWTNFTHFDVLPEQITQISAEYLWYCWKRGVGLQMAHSQDGIDGIIPVFLGDLGQRFDVGEEGTFSEMQAARYMTYIAWEAKNRVDPQPSTDSGPAHLLQKLAGPKIMRASQAPHGEQPLTDRALFSVLLDLGTSVAFAAKPRGLRPRVQSIKGTECPRLCIRGVDDRHAYPCLETFEIRRIFQQILADLTAHPSYAQLNTLPNPVWNDKVRPDLQSFAGAHVLRSDDAAGELQGMEVD